MMQTVNEMLIDAVDDQDRVIGVVPRGARYERRVNFRVAHLFLFNSESALLLQQIAPARPRHPLQWGASAAGHVLAGESYDDAIRRITARELGLVGLRITPVGRTEMREDGCKKFIMLYTGQHDGPFRLDDDQIASVRWWTLPEIGAARQAAPSQFTPTFLHLFEFYERVAGEQGGSPA
ncbi:MAG TPA: NUDIX domain-containing protein [Chloroflexota bacterium]|jgi:16S rRNA (adenine1518-N6/adenine1519-N6)-dimethyltransferase